MSNETKQSLASALGPVLCGWFSGGAYMCIDEFSRIDPMFRPMTWLTVILFFVLGIHLSKRPKTPQAPQNDVDPAGTTTN